MVEILTVMAILGILAALAAPSFTGYMARERVKGAAGEAFADLQYARSEAVQRNATITVTFSGTGYTVARGATNLKTVTLGDGNAVTSGTTVVAVFDPVRATASITDGGVAASTAAVVFANSGTGGTLRVTLNRLGRSEICSPSGAIKGYPSCA